MSENKENFSLDDILNEYSPKQESGGESGAGVNEIIAEVNRASGEPLTPKPEIINEQTETAKEKPGTIPDIKFGTNGLPQEFAFADVTEETGEFEKIEEPEEPEEPDSEEVTEETAAEEVTEETAEDTYPQEAYEQSQEDYPEDEDDGGDEDGYYDIEDEPQEVRTESYSADPKNRGAAFTMRTSDDGDITKKPTGQSEYEKKEDAPEIRRQILRLKNSLIVRAGVTLFAAVFSLFITIANDLQLPLAPAFDRTINPSAYLFTNTILGIIAIGFSYPVITNGIKSIFKGRADSDSVAALNILISVIAGIVTLFDPESLKASFFHLYTSAAITGLLFNTLGKLSIVRRTQRNFEFVSHTDSFSALTQVSDEQTVAYLTNGSSGRKKELAAMRKTGFVRDFMKNSYSSDLADNYAERTTPLILAASLVIGILSIIFEKNSSGTSEKLFVFLASVSGTLAICSSFALTLIVNIPLAQASKKLINVSGVMLGYSSVEEYAEVNSVMIDAGHLFPTGTAQIVNLKVCGSAMIDDCIIYAASLAAAGKSITQPAFYKMLRGKLDMLLPVKGCISENGLGVSGWIDSKRVLLGGRELMEKHGIDGLPTPSAEDSFAGSNRVMYLAVSGRAAMMFAVSLSVGAAAERWVQELEDESIEIHVRCSDGIITRELLAQMFDISASSIRILPSNCDADYEAVTEPADSLSASMFCSGHLPTFSMLLIAAKKVKFAANLGNAVSYGAMILGIVISIIMMLTGSFAQITPTIVLIYNLAFLLLTRLLQKMHKI